MTQKEKRKAFSEVEVMKKFTHPNIVMYYDSFIEDGMLIIIMEYCEEGDLSHHIKRSKKENKYFSEDKILNWFV